MVRARRRSRCIGVDMSDETHERSRSGEARPEAQRRPGPRRSAPETGLYDPQTEKDSCGIGFVANIKGEKSHAIVEQALEVLQRMAHRAATGADPLTGDGAGIMVQVSHRFYKREALELGFELPHRRHYGVGQVFLPN